MTKKKKTKSDDQDDLKNILNEFRAEVSSNFASLNEFRVEANSKFNILDEFRAEVTSKFKSVDGRFDRMDNLIRRQGVEIIDQHDKVMAALDGITSMLGQKDIVQNHEERIEVLEQEVDVVKTIIKNEPRA